MHVHKGLVHTQHLCHLLAMMRAASAYCEWAGETQGFSIVYSASRSAVEDVRLSFMCLISMLCLVEPVAGRHWAGGLGTGFWRHIDLNLFQFFTESPIIFFVASRVWTSSGGWVSAPILAPAAA